MVAQGADSRRKLAQHPLVQQFMLGPVEREPRNFTFAPELYELEVLEPRRHESHRAQHFDTTASLVDHSVCSDSKSLDFFISACQRSSCLYTQSGKPCPTASGKAFL